MPRRAVLPTNAEIVKLTRQLRQQLERLLGKYSEEAIEPSERIFPRLLTHDWRHLRGVGHGPHSLKYVELCHWCNQYHEYLARLRDYCSYVLLDPESFNRVPFNGLRKPPAAECLVLLDAQLKVLQSLNSRTRQTSADESDQISLPEGLRAAVATDGVKKVAAESGCNVDTLRDALAGRTKTRRSTLKKLSAFSAKKNPSV